MEARGNHVETRFSTAENSSLNRTSLHVWTCDGFPRRARMSAKLERISMKPSKRATFRRTGWT